ncbi:IS607 family transposase [Candidatus Poribacteria bacterium]|nr:MAG: IS607 family transposase [Candidatus Poribacteria bacterium]
MKHYKTPRETSEILGISIDRLRRLAENGTISTIRTPGGQRRYDVQGYLDEQTGTDITTIGYCRVSGKGQSDDLASQVAYLQKHYPDAEIIKDYGSGINFKRRGLLSLLERILRGDKLRVIVAHRDRLARFGSEVIQFLVEQNGGEVVVLDETIYGSSEEELTADLLAILHVFSCRLSGLRRYRDQIKEDRNLSHGGTESDSP